MEDLVAKGEDQIDETNAVRLPNAIKRAKNMTLSTDPNAPTQ